MTSTEDTYFTYATPHGPLTLLASQRGIVEVAFEQVAFPGRNAASVMTNRAANELSEYLAGKRRSFDAPIDPRGSSFQKAVWSEVCRVPYGETRTAADIARAIGKPGAHRSVGTAVKQCRLAPLVPAHRVIAPNATGKTAKVMRGFVALERRVVAG